MMKLGRFDISLQRVHVRKWPKWVLFLLGVLVFMAWWIDWQTVPQPTLYMAFLASMSRVLSVMLFLFVLYLATRPLPEHIRQALSQTTRLLRLMPGSKEQEVEEVVFQLEGFPLVIGRSQQCDVVVNTSYVSREHCRVWLDDGRVMLEDLGSSNGTWVGKIQVDKKPIQLAPSHEVLLGGIIDGVRLSLVEEK